MSQECALQVGIRVRPLNERERKLDAQVCVDVSGPTTILNCPPEVSADGLGGRNKEQRRFTFDASFWSCDGFEEAADGYLRPAGSRYVDQQAVFDAFGRQVLDNAWEGYHCCLFAYGQTGSGKSYSMVGYGANRGIVPCACEEIFRRIDSGDQTDVQYEVSVSTVEIYNEQVQDLLMAPKSRPKRGLEIREGMQLGIYVAGVQKRPVDSYKAIERVIDEATANRTVGATLMNATSSRAHTVLTIEFKQISMTDGRSYKVSMINLVDLAGSEKAGQSGASGDRLKEGCAINKSLSALGNVIERLADKATGKAKPGAIVPYRDSKLTRLLQNALGGSSKTVMICAISPASSNYEETLSTLRYADRAKRIRNSAVVNDNPADKLVQQLRQENDQLKGMIGGSEATAAKEAEIAQLEGMLADMQRSFQDKLTEAQQRAEAEEAAKELERLATLSMPHITNLNEDELLTNKLQFHFREGRTRIGRSPARSGDRPEEGPEIMLAGPGLQQEQAVVVNTGGSCKLKAVDAAAAATTCINGRSPAAGEDVVLAHGDRLLFGNCLFLFVDPSKGTASELLRSGFASFEMARKELRTGPSEEEMAESRRKAEELERRVQEAEEAKRRAQSEAEALLQQREREYQAKLQAVNEEWEREKQAKHAAQAEGEATAAEQARAHAVELERLQEDYEARQRQAQEEATKELEALEQSRSKAAAEESRARQQKLNMQQLDECLMMVMPLVKEANLIAQELKRPYSLETKMHVSLAGERTGGAIDVTAAVLQNGMQLYEWTPATLENRVFLMRELLDRCDEEGDEVIGGLSQQDDPWWDPVQAERLIGVAQIILESLTEQLENELTVRILSNEGRHAGNLRIELWPCAKDGSPGVPDEEVVDDLLGTRMVILLRVVRAEDLPEALANDVRVEYDYFIDEQPHHVPPVLGHCCSPEFGYEQRFEQDPITSRFLEYLKTERIMFRVYGRDIAAEQLQAQQARPIPTTASAALPSAVQEEAALRHTGHAEAPAPPIIASSVTPPPASAAAAAAPEPAQAKAEPVPAAPVPAAPVEQAPPQQPAAHKPPPKESSAQQPPHVENTKPQSKMCSIL